MPSEPASRSHALAAIILVLALVGSWFAYAPGLGGPLHFDDHNSLRGLAEIEDSASALRFISSGLAGPTGRPISLATFVPQAYAWPDHTEVFLRTNILIHLLNGVLITWLLYLIGRIRRQEETQAALVAVGAATIWMLMPVLASSSLFIVQRMTTVSAMLMLIGAIGYLYARQSIDRRPALSLFGMTLSIGLGAGLGALAKENGVLLILFIIAIEATLLTRPNSVSRTLWRSWFVIVLGIPLAALSFFLAKSAFYPESIILMRDFNGFERIITQAVILWKYLYLAFIPNIPSIGPFHDDYQAQRSLLALAPFAAVLAWMMVISAAIILRRRAPLFTFAVAWFLFGHLLESTTLHLELYYEHRNYLPLVGPVYAVVAALAQVADKWRPLIATGVIAYVSLLGIVLFSATSLWGSPLIAAEMWHLNKPYSVRAAQNLAGEAAKRGNMYGARRVLRRYIEENPQAHEVRLQALVLSCRLEPGADHSEEIRSLNEQFSRTRFSFLAIEALEQLYENAEKNHCVGVEISDISDLAQSLLENPRFNVPIVRHNIHAFLARVGLQKGDFGLTMLHIEEALAHFHNADTLAFAIGVLASGGRLDIARQLLDEAKDISPPLHPLRAYHWTRQIRLLENALRAWEQHVEDIVPAGQLEKP
jgi:protein O-mannosyl-transferase